MRQAFIRLISLQSFAPAGTQTGASLAGLQSLSPALPQAAQQLQAQQQRGVITVPVQNNKVSKALRTLTRTVFADQLIKEWRGREHFTKPAKQRFLAKKETQVRLRKEAFREKLRWAMQRKAR